MVNTNFPSCLAQTYVSTVYDNLVVLPYFDIAQKYGFCNYCFQSNQGPSFPAHQFIFSATSAPNGVPGQTDYQYFASSNGVGGGPVGCNGPNDARVKVVNEEGIEDVQARVRPCFDHNSLPTLLDHNNVSWKYYASSDENWATSIWTAPNALKSICKPLSLGDGSCTGYDWVNYVVHGQAEILTDMQSSTCRLKNVSWVIPNEPWSDHPGFQHNENDSHQIEGGPAWVAAIINTLGTSACTDTVNGQQVPYWQDTAVFITWDDWGGWWDHVQPYVVRVENHNDRHCDPTQQFGCGFTSGFRVPLLVVSAYTPPGYVSGNTQTQGGEVFPYLHDFGSILAFIEYNFLGITQIGQINAQNNYPFADAFAPDAANGNVPLSDFFPLSATSPRPFQPIVLPNGAPDANYFINYTGPLGDRDNDVVDND